MAAMVGALDEGCDLGFEIARQEVALREDAQSTSHPSEYLLLKDSQTEAAGQRQASLLAVRHAVVSASNNRGF